VIQLILFLLLGALLLASLVFMALQRRPRAEGGAQTIVQARQALGELQSALLPPELVERVFAKEDFEFVVSETREPIHKLFLDERKRIALLWVSQVRAAIRYLRRFYLGAARSYARLNIRTEIELAIDFGVLIVACHALQLLFYWRGPYAAPRIVGAVATAATRICEISETSLAFLNPPELAVVGDRTIGSRAP
jgi:hypothetical protein